LNSTNSISADGDGPSSGKAGGALPRQAAKTAHQHRIPILPRMSVMQTRTTTLNAFAQMGEPTGLPKTLVPIAGLESTVSSPT
jgi:hypothetical protein